MHRYFFIGLNDDGESADAFIDALDADEARGKYCEWCIDVMSETIDPIQIWRLPELSTDAKALNWSEEVESVLWVKARFEG